jgi:hypothetical protein
MAKTTSFAAYVGLMEVIFSPSLDLTHSLLMNKPIGCSYLTPLGAVRLTTRSAILEAKQRLARYLGMIGTGGWGKAVRLQFLERMRSMKERKTRVET